MTLKWMITSIKNRSISFDLDKKSLTLRTSSMKIREILEDSLLIVRFSVYSCRDCLNFLIS